jgi:hypothetical protein
MSNGAMSIGPLDVIFKPLTIRGFWLGHPELATKIAPAAEQAAEMIASGRRTCQWRPCIRSPPSEPPSHMRNAAERSFWTSQDHELREESGAAAPFVEFIKSSDS